VSAVAALVRAHLVLALIATLVLGIACGYALGAYREAEKREACQALAQTLLDVMKHQQEGSATVIYGVSGDAGCPVD